MLNDLLKDRLQSILNDGLILQAIKTIFDEVIERERPKPDDFPMADNNLLGDKYRSYEKAKKIIEKGFIDLMSYKINNNQDKNFNKEK